MKKSDRHLARPDPFSVTRPSLTALILAGSRQGVADPMATALDLSHKALIPIAGKPMILHVVETLRAAAGVDRVVVCIEDASCLQGILPPDVETLPAADGPSASVLAAIHAFGTPLLVTTGDNPLLRPAWVETFLRETATVDIAVGVASEEAVRRDVPGTARTFIRLSDIAFSGCNLFLFRTPSSLRVAELWQSIERERKRPLRMGWKLGFPILLRFLTGRLDSRSILARIRKLTGARGKFVLMPDGRAAVDVDKPADLELVRRLMNEPV